MSKTAKRIKNPEYVEASKSSTRAFSAWKAAQSKTLDAKNKLKEVNREIVLLHEKLGKLEDKSTALNDAFQSAESTENEAKQALEDSRQRVKEIPEWIKEG